jgi:ribosomal protein L1
MVGDKAKTPAKTPAKKSSLSEKKAPKAEDGIALKQRAMTEKKAPKPAATPKAAQSEKKVPKLEEIVDPKAAQSIKKAPKAESAATPKAAIQSAKKAPKTVEAEEPPKAAPSTKKAPKPDAAAATPKASAKKAPAAHESAAPSEKKRARQEVDAPAAKSAVKSAPKSATKSSGGANQSEGLAAVLAQHSQNKLNEELAGRALDALLKYTAKMEASAPKPDLLGGDGEKVHMQLTLKRVPADPSPKPIPLAVPHPVRGTSGENSVCLFVKGDDKAWAKELLMEGAGGPLSGVAKIISLEKLRTNYARFEQRRELLATYDMFMCDDRILPMMTQALGKTFLSRKKQPIAVKVSRKEALPMQIAKLRDCTYMFVSAGTCVSVCIGTTAMSRKHLLENLSTLVPMVVEKLPRKWKNVQAISVKTASSIALPVLNKLPFIVGTSPAADRELESDDDAFDALDGESDDEEKVGGADAKSKAKKSKDSPKVAQKASGAKNAKKAEDTAAAPDSGGKKRRGAFDRKQKAAPAQNTKLDRRSPSPAATRSKKAKVTK